MPTYEELPREDVTCTFLGGSLHEQTITVDLHRDFSHTVKQTGETYYRVAEAPHGNLKFYFLLKPISAQPKPGP